MQAINKVLSVTMLLLFLSMILIEVEAAEKIKKIECTSCHTPESNHAIEAMQVSKHWDKTNKNTPVSKSGCVSCHGNSQLHATTPTKIQPKMSFGPRWTSSVSGQNDTCLNCHEKTASHKEWRQGKHADKDVTCVTCHDLHVTEDPVRIAQKQADVCTVCHKIQKKGIHHFTAKIADNPPCSTCHNPHANPLPTIKMLANRSKGCRSCHDFEKMQLSRNVSDKAKSYHRVMQKEDRTCVDCHAGVAHRNKDNFKQLLASGVHNLSLDLFYPAKSDGDWLLAEHAGAQQLRQGRNCRQCHYNEAKELGLALAPKGIKPSIPAKIKIDKVKNNIHLTVSWQGSINDNSVAVMYDNGQVEDFTRLGCWATCHSDLPGMSKDRGLDKTKYLLSSLKQQYSVGFPAVTFDEEALAEKRVKGEFVELLQASLDKGKLTQLTRFEVLAKRKEIAIGEFSAIATFASGQWVVTFIKPINNKLKFESKTLTLGIAIHRDGESQAEHKVSLPVTVSFDGVGTDFMLK